MKIFISGRYEARSALIVLDGDTSGKEYLFSTSCWYSFTELHDLDSGNFVSWFTPDFLDIGSKYIFSYQYDILRQPNTYNYFIIYCQYEQQQNNQAFSEYYYIRKFKFNSFGGSNSYTHIKEVHESDNENVRLISSFIMKEKSLLVVFYLKYGADPNLILRTYNFDLSTKTDVGVGKTENYPGVTGSFFKALGLGEIYAAIIYYPNFNNQKFTFKIYKYDSGFSSIFSKDISYTSTKADVIKNVFYKINDNRLIFVSEKRR